MTRYQAALSGDLFHKQDIYILHYGMFKNVKYLSPTRELGFQ